MPGENLVTRVIDGDTIEINKESIRIIGIDAYDTNAKMARKQMIRSGYTLEPKKIKEMARLAKEVAKELLENKCVKLESDYRDKGRYGRTLRYIEVGGIDYQEFMIKRGLANVYCGDRKIRRFDQYLAISKFKC